MLSSTHLDAFYQRDQREDAPIDHTMQTFYCLHNVPNNYLEHHVRQRAKFKNIMTVSITGIPETPQLKVAAESVSIPEAETF